MNDQTTNEIPTGEALCKARRRVGHSIESAATAIHIPPSALADYESGMRTPGEDLINELADLYGVERRRLASRPWVPQVPPEYDSETRALSMGWHTIQVQPGNNEHLIRSVAAALRSMRSLAETAPLQIRGAELPLLSSLMDLSDPALTDIMVRYLGLAPDEALGLINEMVATQCVPSGGSSNTAVALPPALP